MTSLTDCNEAEVVDIISHQWHRQFSQVQLERTGHSMYVLVHSEVWQGSCRRAVGHHAMQFTPRPLDGTKEG